MLSSRKLALFLPISRREIRDIQFGETMETSDGNDQVGPASAGLEGPVSGIEAPTGLTPLELKAAEEARRAVVEHLGKNPVLTMDQLVEMKDLRPRLEKEMRLPNDARGSRNRVYFFSIDGTLGGNRLTRCLMAGECIMIQSNRGFEHALRIARDGLHDTMEHAKDYFEELTSSIVVASPLDASHMNVDVGGRCAGHVPGQPDLASDPKLRSMIEHIIGGKRWRG